MVFTKAADIAQQVKSRKGPVLMCVMGAHDSAYIQGVKKDIIATFESMEHPHDPERCGWELHVRSDGAMFLNADHEAR
jgi:hypothetical protein